MIPIDKYNLFCDCDVVNSLENKKYMNRKKKKKKKKKKPQFQKLTLFRIIVFYYPELSLTSVLQ